MCRINELSGKEGYKMNLEQNKTNDDEINSNSDTSEEITKETIEEVTHSETVETTELEQPSKSDVEDDQTVIVEQDSDVTPDLVEEEAVLEENDVEDGGEDPSVVEFYQNILSKIKDVLETKDWGLISNEFSNLYLHIGEGPKPGKASKAILKEFEELKTDFDERKKVHYDELNRKREENLIKKKDLLKSFTAIVNEEKWSATKEVSQIKNSWDRITQLPRGEAETLEERFTALMNEFESHKVDRLVKKLEKEEENLTLKLLLVDKMEALNAKCDNENADFVSLDKEFEELLTQWRKIGRVPNEKNQAAWDRFNKAQDTFNELRFKHDKAYREQVEKSLEKKKVLIDEAESLIDKENIANAARLVNKLHKAWKKTGNLPQKDENELWDRFKAATDAFNDKKSENMDLLREQEQENYEKKLKLIEQADKIKETDDFDKGHQTMQNLMKEWKKIGPVQRKKSSKIWKQFKGAMDEFYNNRRDHFKDRRGEEKENLETKKALLKKLKELGSHEDPVKAVQEAKKIQDEFKEIGYVPIKAKNKIWKEYREVCDVIYERYRSSGADLGMERELAKQGVEVGDRKTAVKLQKEQSAIKKEISKLESESIQYEEAKTFFKPTNKGNKLKDELQEKIEKIEVTISSKQERLSKINRELNDLMSADEEE